MLSTYDDESLSAFAVQAEEDSLEVWNTASADQGKGMITMVVVCQDKGGPRLEFQRDWLLKAA